MQTIREWDKPAPPHIPSVSGSGNTLIYQHGHGNTANVAVNINAAEIESLRQDIIQAIAGLSAELRLEVCDLIEAAIKEAGRPNAGSTTVKKALLGRAFDVTHKTVDIGYKLVSLADRLGFKLDVPTT